MTDPRSDAELSRAVALACGWTWFELFECLHGSVDTRHGPHWFNKHWHRPRIPHVASEPVFATSLDDCFGPSGPAEYAKPKGWTMVMQLVPHTGENFVDFFVWPSDKAIGSGLSKTPARALCLAFLEAAECGASAREVD